MSQICHPLSHWQACPHALSRVRISLPNALLVGVSSKVWFQSLIFFRAVPLATKARLITLFPQTQILSYTSLMTCITSCSFCLCVQFFLHPIANSLRCYLIFLGLLLSLLWDYPGKPCLTRNLKIRSNEKPNKLPIFTWFWSLTNLNSVFLSQGVTGTYKIRQLVKQI